MLGDSIDVLSEMKAGSVDLIMTSPPFGLLRKKKYGIVDAVEYIVWFRQFAKEFHRVLANGGSVVIDIGGAWNQGVPTRHLYHFKLLIMMCEEFGFHLAQDFYWWNPSKLPTPAEWVTIRRVRVKDAINTIWWLSKTPWPKASNRRVLQPYSAAMFDLLERGYNSKKRPSGHDISEKFSIDNGAAIPPNLIAIPNTESNSFYLRHCRERKLVQHPARYLAELPEYFIRMLTDPGDLVVDPFAGSCVTGEVAERLDRKWTCIELIENSLKGTLGRFVREPTASGRRSANPKDTGNYYRVPRPGILWDAPMARHSLRMAAPNAPLMTSTRLSLKLRSCLSMVMNFQQMSLPAACPVPVPPRVWPTMSRHCRDPVCKIAEIVRHQGPTFSGQPPTTRPVPVDGPNGPLPRGAGGRFRGTRHRKQAGTGDAAAASGRGGTS